MIWFRPRAKQGKGERVWAKLEKEPRETREETETKENKPRKLWATDECTASFARATEGSDAESKFEKKWCGVPHWENQPKCKDELVDQVLVEHESPGSHLLPHLEISGNLRTYKLTYGELNLEVC